MFFLFFFAAEIIRGKWKNSKTVVSLLLLFFLLQDSQRIFPKTKRICSFLVLFYFTFSFIRALLCGAGLLKKILATIYFYYYIRFLCLK